MRSTSPNFDDWRALPSIPIWEIAALMQGFDSRAIADVAVRDPNDPTSHYGVPPDLSWDIRTLKSAVKVGDLVTAPKGIVAPDDETEILRTSLVDWLRTNGYVDLADALDVPPGPTGLTPTAAPVQSVLGPSSAASTHAPSNGTAVVWTAERTLEARTMRDNMKARGIKAFAETTAKAFGVSTSRLRAVLADEQKRISVKKPVSSWHP